ncbi:MAG: SGNH/GDSL hydrolase family protein [Ignavibacteriaceae bacterium]
MKKKLNIILGLLLTAAVFFGCQDRSELAGVNPQVTLSGNVDVSKYVSIGNSLTAGYQSSALYQSAQQYSYPNLIAKQGGYGGFAQPLISDPGIGGRIKIVSLDPFVTATDPSSGVPLALTYGAPYDNLGIPGVVLGDVMNSTTTSGSYSKSPFIDIILRGQGTQWQQTKVQQPSLITLWIGNNDVLGFATSGGAKPTSPTPSATFGFLYGQLADSLAATGAKVVVANIPNVTAIPFFTTVGPGFAQMLIAAGAQGFYYQDHNFVPTAGAPAQLSGGQLLLTLVSQSYIAYFGRPSGKFYKDNNLNPALFGVDTTKPFGASLQNPIPNALILDAGEISTANQATTDFNTAITNAVTKYPSQFALVDVNSLFNSIRASDATGGTTYNGVKFTTTFVTGGLFSLDGVHPTAQGQAIVANEFLKVINDKFGSSYPLIDVSAIPGSLTLAKKGAINLFEKGAYLDPNAYKNILF